MAQGLCILRHRGDAGDITITMRMEYDLDFTVVSIAIIQSSSHIKSIVNEKLVMDFMLELFL